MFDLSSECFFLYLFLWGKKKETKSSDGSDVTSELNIFSSFTRKFQFILHHIFIKNLINNNFNVYFNFHYIDYMLTKKNEISTFSFSLIIIK